MWLARRTTSVVLSSHDQSEMTPNCHTVRCPGSKSGSSLDDFLVKSAKRRFIEDPYSLDSRPEDMPRRDWRSANVDRMGTNNRVEKLLCAQPNRLRQHGYWMDFASCQTGGFYDEMFDPDGRPPSLPQQLISSPQAS
jgi:hypothetical protein